MGGFSRATTKARKASIVERRAVVLVGGALVVGDGFVSWVGLIAVVVGVDLQAVSVWSGVVAATLGGSLEGSCDIWDTIGDGNILALLSSVFCEFWSIDVVIVWVGRADVPDG